MMETNCPAGLIEQARAALREARGLVARATLENMDAATFHLESAAHSLGEAVAALRCRSLDPGARGAAASAFGAFRRELAQVDALHKHAASLQLGWMRALSVLAGADYAPFGQPAWPMPRPLGRRVSVDA